MAEKITDINDAIAKAQATAMKSLSSGRANGTGTPPAEAVQGPLLVPIVEWFKESEPPVWVVEGIVQQGYIYALTAVTNHGKTAISLLMGLCVAAGKRFAGHDIRKGAVLMLCGENPEGFRTRLRATLTIALNLEVEDVAGAIVILPASLPLRNHLDQIKSEAAALDLEFSLVIIDTSVTYFTGEDENDNLAMRDHALDMRELTELPGRPAVIANCHPTASADRENLRPRGGGAFLNEIDGNLTVWAEGETAEFHWQRKKRGPDFDPIPFEFHGVSMEDMGVAVPTVYAQPISEERELEIRRKRRESEDRLLYALRSHPGGSISDWCSACGWDPKKSKSKVHRILTRLKEHGLAKVHRGWWSLTPAGEKEAQGIK